MHLAKTSSAAKRRWNSSCVEPGFGSKKLATAIPRVLTLAVLSALPLIAARPAQAQTETVLYNFCSVESKGNCVDGANPQSSLTSYGGNFYGTTQVGGVGWEDVGLGTVFELSPNGSGGWNETVLYSFCPDGGVCADGAYPDGPVVFDSVGNLYGIVPEGGNSNCGFNQGCGVAFELSPVGAGWTETVVYDFCSQIPYCSDGDYPGGGVVMDAAGNLYGQLAAGPFELSPSPGGWTEKIISPFVRNSRSGLTMDTAGNMFGMASNGAGQRVVFELSPNGEGGWNTTVLYIFTASGPNRVIWSALTLDQAGNLYGTETGWYQFAKPHNFRGMVYKLSLGKSGWTKKVLFTFKPDNGATEGNVPGGGIALGAGGNFYGTTIQGGTYGLGTVFELVPGAKGKYEEQVLWNFNGIDGSQPQGNLVFDSAGNLYGTTSGGGLYGGGTVFEITP